MNYAVIMAGGSGQRLWPLSRTNRPKQIIDLVEGQSLLRHCVNRIQAIFDPEHILVVTNADYADVVRQHLPELPDQNILGEPVGRDTANAIGLAAAVLDQRCPDAMMAVFSADQIIKPIEPLQHAVHKALKFLEKHPEALFTFGIKATSAHTGFGYLKRGEASHEFDDGIFPVAAFREKPNKVTARKYIRSGNYCWNSGIFVWRVDTVLHQLETYLPHNADRLARLGKAWNTDTWETMLQDLFPELEKISIDFAVLEHAKHVFMCELDCHWSDVGSYAALSETVGITDEYENIRDENTLCELLDSSRNITISQNPDHLIAAIGVEDLIIVNTADATLICRRGDTESIKRLLTALEEQQERIRFL